MDYIRGDAILARKQILKVVLTLRGVAQLLFTAVGTYSHGFYMVLRRAVSIMLGSGDL